MLLTAAAGGPARFPGLHCDDPVPGRPAAGRALPFHWKFGQAARQRTGTHPQLLDWDCEPHRGKARQQLGEDSLQFDAGERGAEAVVGAVPE